MRKIKFRAWHKPTQLMDDVVLIDFYNEKIGILYADPVVQCESVQKYNFNEVEIMQCTGIKDKNGVEIFEGDIVKMYCSFKDIYGTSLETHEDEITIIGVVRIDMTTGMYLEVDDETENYYWHEFYRDPAEHFEIIGNIHENPELMV